MRKFVLSMGLGAAMAGTAVAQAPPPDGCHQYPGMLCNVEASIGPDLVPFSKDTPLRYHSLRIRKGTVMRTNGHALTIDVDEDLVVEEAATIESFDPSAAAPAVPAKPAAGAVGETHDPGPNTEGAAVATNGAVGGRGAHGTPGTAGTPGASAGAVILRIGGSAKGVLRIVNAGAVGGAGGPGGDGGPGGTGQQGGRARPKDVFGLPAGCADGPGHGGDGGQGGPGGAGGPGGPGGYGGPVTVSVSRPGREKLKVEASAPGGLEGAYGPDGTSGRGGGPGFGGRGATGCNGEEIGRRGKAGTSDPTPPTPAHARREAGGGTSDLEGVDMPPAPPAK